MRVLVDLDDVQVDNIVSSKLLEAYALLEKPDVAVFTTDKKKDKKMVKALREAIRCTHNYFSVPDKHI